MLNVLRNWLDDNAREVKRLQRVVDSINGLESKMTNLTDADLQAKTITFKDRLAQGEKLAKCFPRLLP